MRRRVCSELVFMREDGGGSQTGLRWGICARLRAVFVPDKVKCCFVQRPRQKEQEHQPLIHICPYNISTNKSRNMHQN